MFLCFFTPQLNDQFFLCQCAQIAACFGCKESFLGGRALAGHGILHHGAVHHFVALCVNSRQQAQHSASFCNSWHLPPALEASSVLVRLKAVLPSSSIVNAASLTNDHRPEVATWCLFCLSTELHSQRVGLLPISYQRHRPA